MIDKLASKEELERTREELTGRIEETREELIDKIASKEELGKVKDSVDLLAAQVATNITDIGIIQQQIILILQRLDKQETKADADRKFNLIMQAIDGLSKKIDDYRVEKSAMDHSLLRHD